MRSEIDDVLGQIERDGFSLVPAVYAANEVAALRVDIEARMGTLARDGETIRSRGGAAYAARNLLEWLPATRDVWRRPPLASLLGQVLGPDYGLVRALFFDKPPERTWSLPWHKDKTIAVADNQLPSERFRRPTHKAGVPHVEAPVALLERMLTARIHLDDVTEENGPLEVLSGSHRDATMPAAQVESEAYRAAATERDCRLDARRKILARAGDVLLMRPLLTHSSGQSAADTRRHRRIVHLEFAGQRQLPDGYRWHDFLAGKG